MLISDLLLRAYEGTLATKPLIDENAEGILIAGNLCISKEAFWSHISDGSPSCDALCVATLYRRGNTKVSQQDTFILSY